MATLEKMLAPIVFLGFFWLIILALEEVPENPKAICPEGLSLTKPLIPRTPGALAP
jgi:hypothetical protein